MQSSVHNGLFATPVMRTSVWSRAVGRVQYLLFPLALLALFIPIPRFGLPISPENSIYFLFAFLWLTGTLQDRARMPTEVVLLTILTIAFMLAQYVIKWWCYGSPIWEPTLVRRVLLLVMACHVITDPVRLRMATACVVAGMLVSGTVGILTVFRIEPVASLFNRFVELGACDIDQLEQRTGMAARRLVGLRGSVFGFSYLTAPAFLLLCGFLADALWRRRVGRVFACVAGMFIVLLCMVLNAERSAFLALAAGLVAFVAHVRKIEIAALALAPIILVFVAMSAWNGQLLAHQGDARHNIMHRVASHDQGEFVARAALAYGGILTVLDHPFSGGNEEDYQRTAGSLGAVKRFFMNRGELPASHNSYVNAGMRTGFLGWALLVAILVGAMRMLGISAARTSSATGNNPLVSAMRGGFIACMVNAVFHNQGVMSGEPMTWAVLALAAGALAMPATMHAGTRARQQESRCSNRGLMPA